MPAEVQEVGDVAVVRPEDDLALLGYQQFEASIDKLLHEGQRKIVIDLGRASYVNSFTIRVLMTIMQKAKKSGGAIVLANVGGGARVSLDAGGVLKVVQVFKSVDEAVSALGAR